MANRTDAELVRVASSGNNEEASILRSYLEHHGIHVYVQGENHRSMLGMVGAFIDLNIMVPRHDAENACRLLEEFHAAEVEDDGLETRGPFRDQDEPADDEDDKAYAQKVEIRRIVRGARLIGLFLPFGTVHVAAGARALGVVFILLSVAGIVLGFGRYQALGVLWPLALVLDFALVPRAVRRRANSSATR